MTVEEAAEQYRLAIQAAELAEVESEDQSRLAREAFQRSVSAGNAVERARWQLQEAALGKQPDQQAPVVKSLTQA